MDLKEVLITRLGDGPGHRPVAERIAAGKAARRRRRAVVAVGCLTAVVLLGGAGYATVALTQRDSAAPDDRTATVPHVDSAPTAVVKAPERAWPEVILDARATLYVPADAEVVSTIENPLGVSAPLHSVAVELEYDGQPGWFIEVHEGEGTSGFAATAEEHQEFATFEAWVKARSAGLVKARGHEPERPTYEGGDLRLPAGARVIQRVDTPMGLGIEVETGGKIAWCLLSESGGTYDQARRSFPTFEAWLDDAVALQEGQPTLALVAFSDDGSLRPLPGVKLVQQRQRPDVGSNFAPAGAERTAVAEVVHDGETWFVLARDLDGSIQYFPSARSVTAPTLDGFLKVAKASYDAGLGLR